MVAAAAVTGVAAVGIFSLDLPFGLGYACAPVFAATGGLLPATVLALVPNPALVPITHGMIVQAIGIGTVVGPIATGAPAAAGGRHASPFIVCTAAATALLLALRVRRLGTTPAGATAP